MTKRSLAGLYALVSAVWVWLFLPTSMVHAAPSQAPAEIEHLLVFVTSSGCTFHRNGSDHDSADAADHLRLKYSPGQTLRRFSRTFYRPTRLKELMDG